MRILLCPFSDPGYLYPTIAVGIELQRRGHQVFLLGRESAQAAATSAGLPLIPVADRGMGTMSVRLWFRRQRDQYQTVRNVARDLQPDLIVTSVLCHGSLLAAETLDIPAVVLGLTAHLWNYRAGAEDEPELPTRRHWRTQETLRFYHNARSEAALPACSDATASRALLGAAFLLRGAPAFEYPGAQLPDGVHHVGPCPWEPQPDPEALGQVERFESRSDKPLVYVHLGRSFQGVELWPRLNAAFTDTPFRAVVELGRSDEPTADPRADILTVQLPWMAPLIQKSRLVISSATSASVLSALTHGRPLLVGPAGSEQPLLAEACTRAGVARHLPEDASPEIPRALAEALHDEGLHRRAQALGHSLRRAGGTTLAADHIEHAAGTRTTVPVLAAR
ncbi:glycosyltransferase [Kitasatospora sp. LaBMicrA B282]|uniref:glycosyltransferase n=1 Tax=Kitasatospora sp. LaBMicrA B282 TaxID=3420949 RepID=UPI003D0B9CBC